MLKDILKKKYYLNKIERQTLYIGLIICLFSVISYLIIKTINFEKDYKLSITELSNFKELDNNSNNKYLSKNNKFSKKTNNYHTKIIDKKLNFDINKCSLNDFINLGFSKKQAQIIVNYRSKGGKFYKKEDLKKIFVVSDEMYERIKNNIFVQVIQNNSSNNKDKELDFVNINEPKIKIKNNKIDINTCTQQDYESLYGIGEKLSARIIKFRNNLGYFYSINQIKEVYGISDEIYNNIKDRLSISNIETQKIILDKNTKYEVLIKHPYIDKAKALKIINYLKYNDIKKIIELKQIEILNNDEFEKLSNYLIIGD